MKTNDELQAAARNCRSEHSDIEQLRQQVLDLQIQNDELRPCKINFDAAKRLQDLSFSQIKELREHRDEVQQDLSNLKSQMQRDLGIHTTAIAGKDQIIEELHGSCDSIEWERDDPNEECNKLFAEKNRLIAELDGLNGEKADLAVN